MAPTPHAGAPQASVLDPGPLAHPHAPRVAVDPTPHEGAPVAVPLVVATPHPGSPIVAPTPHPAAPEAKSLEPGPRGHANAPYVAIDPTPHEGAPVAVPLAMATPHPGSPMVAPTPHPAAPEAKSLERGHANAPRVPVDPTPHPGAPVAVPLVVATPHAGSPTLAPTPHADAPEAKSLEPGPRGHANAPRVLADPTPHSGSPEAVALQVGTPHAGSPTVAPTPHADAPEAKSLEPGPRGHANAPRVLADPTPHAHSPGAVTLDVGTPHAGSPIVAADSQRNHGAVAGETRSTHGSPTLTPSSYQDLPTPLPFENPDVAADAAPTPPVVPEPSSSPPPTLARAEPPALASSVGATLRGLARAARTAVGLSSRTTRVDPWGRDEALTHSLRPLGELLYERYWRVQVEGAHHVPNEPCLIVANHAGALPLDGPVLHLALRRERPELQGARWLLEDQVFHAPFVGVLANRLGAVRASPENAYRLLEEGRPLIVFPEGFHGLSKPFAERYQLRRFGRGGYVKIALKAMVPVVPVAIVGGEESMPLLAKLPGRPFGVQYLPLTLPPLPARWHLRFAEPHRFDDAPRDAEGNQSWVTRANERVRDVIQGMLTTMLRERTKVF